MEIKGEFTIKDGGNPIKLFNDLNSILKNLNAEFSITSPQGTLRREIYNGR